jgi:protein-disulfide isomerase
MSQRFKRLAAAGVAAVIVAAGAIAVSSSGGSPPAKPTTDAASLFAGVPERHGVAGDPGARVTVTEYLDLQCPICGRAASSTLPTVVDDYVRTGKVKLAARTLHFLGPDSVRAARVAAGAERQNKLWPFLEAFYSRQGTENSGYVTDAFLAEVSRAAGVDAKPATAQADSAFASGRLERANADATRLGINGTPTLTVRVGDGPERVLAADPLDPASVSAALDKVLAR